MDEERRELVERLVSRGYLKSKRVIEAMSRVPRHLFMPGGIRDRAYADTPQPIGSNQTISAPHMVAIMTELLDVREDSHILEVGTGSGYQAAILAELAREGDVVTVERVPELAERSRELLRSLRYDNVEVVDADGTMGHAGKAPYDRILVTAASPGVPKALADQLADDGRMLIPVGGRSGQTLLEIRKDASGRPEEICHGGCVFVPLIGEDGWDG
ncbi:MAG: protein-L-isoaspartate O-methyltransferase [Candidatus Altiarchaeales archaeon]|nr:protein-L-isoaspartate O-methyltransferase [Candidatus Altiarchaeales archaeon]MBD3416181.1 protein-L-isoaspartate O-methyltransferase [Candidatus Altiarchaeales archaeon]